VNQWFGIAPEHGKRPLRSPVHTLWILCGHASVLIAH